MTTSASATDRTVNRVALCSAIFAGCAYVGYSVVRQAFNRNLVATGGGRRRGRKNRRKAKSVAVSKRKVKGRYDIVECAAVIDSELSEQVMYISVSFVASSALSS
jgi:hypothetical protein